MELSIERQDKFLKIKEITLFIICVILMLMDGDDEQILILGLNGMS